MNQFSRQFVKFPALLKFGPVKLPPGLVQIFWDSNDSRINPHIMCAKFGCSQTVVSEKKGGYRQTDRQTRTHTKGHCSFI